MTYKLKISKQKQVTLPVALLKQLGLNGGDYLFIESEEDHLIIPNNKARINSLAGSLGSKIKDKSLLFNKNHEYEKAVNDSKEKIFKSKNG